MIQQILAIWSGSSAFSKSSLEVLGSCTVEDCLENFEHYFPSMWNEYNIEVVWTFFAIVLLWDWTKCDKLVDIWNVCICILYGILHGSVQPEFSVFSKWFSLTKSTHNPNPHYTQIVTEFINHIGINSYSQGTCYCVTDSILDIKIDISSKQLDL